MNGTQKDPKVKTRRLFVRGLLIAVYGLFIAVTMFFGKGHTLLIDNKDSEDGTVKAIESMTVSVNGEEPVEYMSGDRDMTKVRAQWHTLKIDINGQVVEKKITIPVGQDMVLVSIPKLMAGVEPAVVPFVLADEPPPAEEPAGNENAFTSPDASEAPAAPAAPETPAAPAAP